jgi:hypothetical protein
MQGRASRRARLAATAAMAAAKYSLRAAEFTSDADA